MSAGGVTEGRMTVVQPTPGAGPTPGELWTALVELSDAAADYLYAGEDEEEWKRIRLRLVKAVSQVNDWEQARAAIAAARANQGER